MKHAPRTRRTVAAVAGLALGLGGALATTAPAQAEEIVTSPPAKGVVNCSTQTISPDRTGPEDTGIHLWRLIFTPEGGVTEVVWQSGGWPQEVDVDLGDDITDLIDKGWAVNDFEVTVPIEGLPDGTFEIQWWDHEGNTRWERVSDSANQLVQPLVVEPGFGPAPRLTRA